jgi:DNA-binding NtrC family response regulator
MLVINIERDGLQEPKKLIRYLDGDLLIKVQNLAQKASMTQFSVLIVGEKYGCRNEAAKIIYDRCKGQGAIFIRVDCRCLESPHLDFIAWVVDSFYRRGGLGKNSLCCLYFDEIDQLSLECQKKLLGMFLEFDKMESDFLRVIASSSSQIEEKLQNNLFRSDLFFRLKFFWVDLRGGSLSPN